LSSTVSTTTCSTSKTQPSSRSCWWARDLSVRRFSPQAQKLVGLQDADEGRPIGRVRRNLVFASAGVEFALRPRVIATTREQEPEVRDIGWQKSIRFNRLAVARELRMIALKKEINDLRQQQGQAARYPLEFESDGTTT
jgi:hypothetical protein